MARKKKAKAKLRKKQGIRVLGGPSMKITVEDVNRAIDDMRREREEQLLGPGFKTRKKRAPRNVNAR
jgi:hypothetical protein